VKLRTLFGVESRDGRGMNTSSRGNGVSRMVSIKHGKDTVLLYRKRDLMMIMVRNKKVCEFFQTQT
jgi:hypothetical protein